MSKRVIVYGTATEQALVRTIEELKRENAALREAKDAYFKYNKILVMLITEEQKKKALEILMSRPKEAQP